jgi:hypothetical protein
MSAADLFGVRRCVMKPAAILALLLMWTLIAPNLMADESRGTENGGYAETSGVSPLETTNQRNEREVSLFWAIFLNILPGFGVGSFVQGNGIAGTLQLVVQGVPFGYSGYRSFELIRDWHPALYIAWPFIVPFYMLVEVWPLFTYGAGMAYGIVSAVRTHRASQTDSASQKHLALTLEPDGLAVVYRY